MRSVERWTGSQKRSECRAEGPTFALRTVTLREGGSGTGDPCSGGRGPQVSGRSKGDRGVVLRGDDAAVTVGARSAAPVSGATVIRRRARVAPLAPGAVFHVVRLGSG